MWLFLSIVHVVVFFQTLARWESHGVMSEARAELRAHREHEVAPPPVGRRDQRRGEGRLSPQNSAWGSFRP